MSWNTHIVNYITNKALINRYIHKLLMPTETVPLAWRVIECESKDKSPILLKTSKDSHLSIPAVAPGDVYHRATYLQ